MAMDETRHPGNERIYSDLEVLRAILNLRDYQPINPAYSTEALSALAAALASAEQAEQLAETTYASARDTKIDAAWALHNAILAAKTQVIAQYGPNSNEVESLGLKKKSARRRPLRRSSSASS